MYKVKLALFLFLFSLFVTDLFYATSEGPRPVVNGGGFPSWTGVELCLVKGHLIKTSIMEVSELEMYVGNVPVLRFVFYYFYVLPGKILQVIFGFRVMGEYFNSTLSEHG